MAITAQEWELLGCFGVEPELLDAGVPWCYNAATYTVEVDGLSLSFVVEPASYEVRVLVRRGSQRLYELNARSVKDIRVIDEPGRDLLEICLTDRESVLIQVRPVLEITQWF